MSIVWQIGCEPLWAVGSFYGDPEPFAHISEWNGSFQAEDVDDGPLGSRRTLAEAVALVDQHNADLAIQQAAHTVRVNAVIATQDAAPNRPRVLHAVTTN
jgi:hypothetical protein